MNWYERLPRPPASARLKGEKNREERRVGGPVVPVGEWVHEWLFHYTRGVGVDIRLNEWALLGSVGFRFAPPSVSTRATVLVLLGLLVICAVVPRPMKQRRRTGHTYT